jgi:hypothetical protein
MKTLMFLFAAVGMLIVGFLRPARPVEEDDDVGLFIGSAHPVAARAQVGKGAISSRRRSQKRSRVV